MIKKVLMVALVGMASLPALSQNVIDQVEVNAGMNISKMKWYDSKIGYHVGLRATKNLDKLAPGVYGNAGLFLTSKGGKMDLGGLGNSTLSANYLEVPVHFGYKYALNENVKLFGEVGPYFDLGLFGKQKNKTLDFGWDDDDNSYEEESASTFEVLKRFDFGLGLRVGAEYKKFTLSFGYDAGVIDIYKSDPDDDDLDITGAVHNSNFTVSVGYIF